MCCSIYQCFIPFYGQIIFHCLDIPCFVYPFISWWTSRFFHFLVTMNKDVIDIHAKLLMCTYVLILLRPRNRIAGPYSNPEMDHLRNGQTVFQSIKAVPLSIPLVRYEGTIFFIYSPTLVLIWYFDVSYPMDFRKILFFFWKKAISFSSRPFLFFPNIPI